MRQKVIPGLIAAWVVLPLLCQQAASEDLLEVQAKALSVITKTAAEICNQVSARGTASGLEVSGDVNARLSGLARRIADLGIQGAAKYTEQEYTNVLQKDLADTIKTNTNCRESVFKLLQDKMIPSITDKRSGASPFKLLSPVVFDQEVSGRAAISDNHDVIITDAALRIKIGSVTTAEIYLDARPDQLKAGAFTELTLFGPGSWRYGILQDGYRVYSWNPKSQMGLILLSAELDNLRCAGFFSDTTHAGSQCTAHIGAINSAGSDASIDTSLYCDDVSKIFFNYARYEDLYKRFRFRECTAKTSVSSPRQIYSLHVINPCQKPVPSLKVIFLDGGGVRHTGQVPIGAKQELTLLASASSPVEVGTTRIAFSTDQTDSSICQIGSRVDFNGAWYCVVTLAPDSNNIIRLRLPAC